MYRSFYGLNALPFQISTDPTFLWLGEKHREAISMLKYGIQGDGHTGLLLLTGDVGTGKTTLVNALFKSLDKTVIRAAVTNPNLESLDFLNYIAAAFGSKKEFTSKYRFLISFERFLKNANAKNRKVLLVIDEAQLLSDDLLEEIRLFSNMEKDGHSLIHTFLVGQSELRGNLDHPANRALKQRITLNYNIDALVFEETDEYIKYRLQVAGTSESIFDPDAVQQIHKFSQGLPRKINIICDHALLTGYVKGQKRINAGIVRECARELSISAPPQHRRTTEVRSRDDQSSGTMGNDSADNAAHEPGGNGGAGSSGSPDDMIPDPPVKKKRLSGFRKNHIAAEKKGKKTSRKPLYALALCVLAGLLALGGYIFLA